MLPSTTSVAIPTEVTAIQETEPGLEKNETCDLCDGVIQAGTAAAVLYYANSHGFAHAECIDLLRLPSETARLL
jgi:hypothetical protein